MINSRYSTSANRISHNYLCKPDRHQGWARSTELVDIDWVICPLLVEAEGLWDLDCGEPLCRCEPTPYRKQNPLSLNTKAHIHSWLEEIQGELVVKYI